jgi:hypothetical protein
MKTVEEILEEIQLSEEKALEAKEYWIGDRKLTRQDIKTLMEYEDRMLSRKAIKDNKYKSRVAVRFSK